jgi:hypothetical protein
MLAMAVISVSVGAESLIDDFNDINAIEKPIWLPKLPSGGVENWCLTPFVFYWTTASEGTGVRTWGPMRNVAL